MAKEHRGLVLGNWRSSPTRCQHSGEDARRGGAFRGGPAMKNWQRRPVSSTGWRAWRTMPKRAFSTGLPWAPCSPWAEADLARLVGSMDSIANLAPVPWTVSPCAGSLFPRHKRADGQARPDRPGGSAGATGCSRCNGDRPETRHGVGEAGDRIESRADDVYSALYQSMFEVDTDYKTFHSSSPSSSVWRRWPTAVARTPSSSAIWPSSTWRTSDRPSPASSDVVTRRQ